MMVRIASPTADALIRYTVDGTTPSSTVGLTLPNGGVVTVDRTTTLKAIAYKSGWTSSAVVSALYTLNVEPLTLTRRRAGLPPKRRDLRPLAVGVRRRTLGP